MLGHQHELVVMQDVIPRRSSLSAKETDYDL